MVINKKKLRQTLSDLGNNRWANEFLYFIAIGIFMIQLRYGENAK